MHEVLWPMRWLIPHEMDAENLDKHLPFSMISLKQGVHSARHEVSRDEIEADDLKKGEQCTIYLTDKCL